MGCSPGYLWGFDPQPDLKEDTSGKRGDLVGAALELSAGGWGGWTRGPGAEGKPCFFFPLRGRGICLTQRKKSWVIFVLVCND